MQSTHLPLNTAALPPRHNQQGANHSTFQLDSDFQGRPVVTPYVYWQKLIHFKKLIIRISSRTHLTELANHRLRRMIDAESSFAQSVSDSSAYFSKDDLSLQKLQQDYFELESKVIKTLEKHLDSLRLAYLRATVTY